MDFNFFESLSKDDARKYLNNFLDEEKKVFIKLKCDYPQFDFSVESIKNFFKYVFLDLKKIDLPIDEDIPKWIRDTDSYQKGHFEFDDNSKILILRSAYYLGQSFVTAYSSLKWDIGNEEYIQKNMPIVKGFKSKLELPVLMVAENIFRSAIADSEKLEPIVEQTTEFWMSKVR